MASVFDGVWGFSSLGYEPKSDDCVQETSLLLGRRSVGCNVVLILGRNNVTKYIGNNVAMVPSMYSTDFLYIYRILIYFNLSLGSISYYSNFGLTPAIRIIY